MSATKGRYAAETTVAADRSLGEIKRELQRFGADDFAVRENPAFVSLLFVIRSATPEERRIRFTMFLPDPGAEAFAYAQVNQSARRRRTDAQRHAAWQQEVNRKWRALAAAIKGKLIAVAEGFETIEEAFWAHLLTPKGTTIYEETHARVAEAYQSGTMPELLPDLPRPAPLGAGPARPLLEGRAARSAALRTASEAEGA